MRVDRGVSYKRCGCGRMNGRASGRDKGKDYIVKGSKLKLIN